MELTIDGQICDLKISSEAVPGYDAAKTADLEAAREGRTLKLMLPATSRNDAIAGFARDPHAASRFNAALHRAELRAEGALLLAGTVRLLGCSDEGYTVEIRDGGALWAQNAALRMFNTLGISYRASLLPTVISQSWTDDSPVKFFPIHRDEYEQQNGSADLLPAERILSVDDYHPFLHIATLTEAIFTEAGYKLRSRFMESAFFRSLYLSGAYVSRDTTAANNRMGFFARRLSAKTAVADDIGRVYANPASQLNSVGNIVETATPQSLDVDKEPIPELCNNGGCFGIIGGRIAFTPPTEVSVGFEYYLKYTTGHRILNRTRLRGFDSVYLGTGSQFSFTLANRYQDRREALTANRNYLAIVFSHIAGTQYRLTYTRNGTAGTLWSEFTNRTASVTTPASGIVSNPVLLIRNGSSWAPYAGDWALYDGYITETGQTTVEVRMRTAAEIIRAGSSKHFDLIDFSGAEPGTSLTLHKQSSLQPRFLSSPGYGSTIEFADVAHHRIRQAELLEGLAQLFNLRFYTDQESRTVIVEPADDFAGTDGVVDWSLKTDFSQPVLLADIAPEVHQHRTWSYMTGDGAVSRFDNQAESPFGEWHFSLDSYAAKAGVKEVRNPLFRPTINSVGHYLNAPSARIMQVGDRDSAEQDGTNFTPRIVRFEGMHPLPAGERWGYPSNGNEYPLAAFHFQGDAHSEGFTLCFEDRDKLTGLHRYYDRQLAQESSRQRITLWLRIAPHEFEALFTPGIGAPSIRSAFRIDTGSGVVCATLERIETYDPSEPSTRCVFTRLITD